jgi:hypothetical protein
MKTALAVALALGGTAVANADVPSLSNAPAVGFSYSGDQNTWHTVMLVSAVVAIVGLVQDDSTLVLLGAGGVILGAVESSQSRFRYGITRPGVDLVKTGPVSFGVRPYEAPALG